MIQTNYLLMKDGTTAIKENFWVKAKDAFFLGR